MFSSISRHAGCQCETLERRMLLSLSPVGSEFRVNTFTTSDQTTPSIAADADGDFVVVWDSFAQDGSNRGIFARRYNSAGAAQGSEFRVNTFTTGDQRFPSVAMDADGDFVIAWDSDAQDGSSFGIFAQRYNALGVAQGGEFRVNTFTTGDQSVPVVAMNANGDFVIAWNGNGSGDTDGSFARRYNAAGVAQGNEFRANTSTTNSQRNPSLAMDANGDFIIAWSGEGLGDTGGIFAQRYNALGVPQSSEFRVNTVTTGTQVNPSVAMDAAGDFVVAWTGAYDIFAQRYNAAAVAQGTEFRVNTIASGFQLGASAAMDADGDFLIAWSDSPSFVAPGDVLAHSYNAAGIAQGADFLVNTFTTSIQDIPRVALDADGNAFVAWRSFDQDGSGEGIYSQRYSEANPDIAAPMVGGVFVGGEEIFAGQRVEDVVSSLVLSFSEDMSIAGGTSGVNSATNRLNYRLTRNGIDASSQINSASFTFNATTRKYQTTLSLLSPGLQSGSYVVTARDTLRDLSGNSLDGNFDGIPGGDFTRAFSVVQPVAVGSEFRVNFNTTNEQRVPAVAREDNGDFIVVWQSDGQDGSFYGVYGRRYSAAGVAQPEFRVNAITTNQQRNPSVAMDADGDFVVAWNGFGAGDTDGVFARRYNSNGLAQGIEFKVNTYTTGRQEFPAVAMDAAGNFVIAWQSDAQEGTNDFGGIFAQRFNAAGAPQGGEIHVNTTTPFEQYSPSVAMDIDGDFVITWESSDELHADYDIFAQRYNAAGVAQGVEFRVHSNTGGDQIQPSVSMSASGDFVVAWYNQFDIAAQRYNAAGVAQGGQFVVDDSGFPGTDGSPSVALDADGNFVIAWGFESDFGDPTTYDVYARRYNSAGVAQGGKFPINSFTTGQQNLPAVAMDAVGDFVIAWHSQDQDGSGFGIYAQRYARLTEVNVSDFLFQTAPHRLQFTFNDNVSASLGTNDIVLENLTTSTTIPSSDLALSFDAATNTATFSYTGNAGGFTGVLPDGNYRATLIASGITNPSGTPLAANHVFNFFFLNGDANHDARVNLTDFNILAGNFGLSPRTFSQADFNYDGLVNLIDFNILAGRFGGAVGPQAFSSMRIGGAAGQRRILDALRDEVLG